MAPALDDAERRLLFVLMPAPCSAAAAHLLPHFVHVMQ